MDLITLRYCRTEIERCEWLVVHGQASEEDMSRLEECRDLVRSEERRRAIRLGCWS